MTPFIRAFAHKHLLAGVKADVAGRRFEAAVVFNMLGDEIKRLAIADLDCAIVDDAGHWRWAGELPGSAGTEVGHERRGGGDETAADLDHGVRAEIEAVGIGEDDGAVGIERAPYLGRAIAADVVEYDRTGRRLNKAGGFTVLDVEAAPVEEGVLADGDVEPRANRLRVGRTGNDGHALGIGHQAERAKHQTPNFRETSSINLQSPEKHRADSRTCSSRREEAPVSSRFEE